MTILDSRDLEEELQELKEQEEKTEEDKERIKQIEELKEETESYGWEYGIIFISESKWEDYCQELAEDCGYVNNKENNPLMNCIDWEQWADMLEQDYSMVNFNGDSYYYREA